MKGNKLSQYRPPSRSNYNGNPSNVRYSPSPTASLHINSMTKKPRPSSASQAIGQSSSSHIPSYMIKRSPKANQYSISSIAPPTTNQKIYQEAIDTFNKSQHSVLQDDKNGDPRINGSQQIEETYIRNLQQQIQFLEMELDLQRRIGAEKSKPDNIKVEPLEETIRQIKLKFLEKEKEYKSEIKKLRDELERIRQGEKSEQFKIERLKLDLEDLEEQDREILKREKRKLTNEIVELEKKIEKLENDLIVKGKQMNHLEKEKIEAGKERLKLKTDNEKLQSEIKALKGDIELKESRIKELEDKVAGLISAKNEENSKHMNWELTIKSLKEELEHYQNENMKVEKARNELEIEKSKLYAIRDRLEHDLKECQEKNISLQQANNSLQKTLQVLQVQIKQMQKNEKDMLARQLASEQIERELRKKAEHIHGDHSKLQSAYLTLQENMEEEHTLRDKQKNELLAYKYKEEQNKEFNDRLSKDDEELRQNNRALQEEVKDLDARLKIFEKKNYDLEMTECELKAQLDNISKQLELSLLIDDLNSSDLSGLMKQNMNVAEKITLLMKFMSTVPKTAFKQLSSESESKYNIAKPSQEIASVDATTPNPNLSLSQQGTSSSGSVNKLKSVKSYLNDS